MMRIYWALVTCVTLFLCGCAQIADDLNGRSVSMSGAGVVLGAPIDPIPDCQLAALIFAATPAPPAKSPAPCPSKLSTFDSTGKEDVAYQLGEFGKPIPASSTEQNAYRYARNEVLGYIITASNNRCNAFKLALRERSTNFSFGLGALATSFGAAGAVFTNGTSQILSGLSAATSGVNAEYNKDVLSSVTSSVIIPGIDKQRAAILQEVMNRRCYGVESYSLPQSLADAVKYHAACSTDVGVAAASSALSQTHSQSLSDAQATVAAIVQMHNTLYNKTSSSSGGTPAATPGGTQAKGGATSPPAADAAGSATTGQQNATDPLLGEALNLGQCPSLGSDGLLPATAASATGSTTAKGQVPSDVMPAAPAAAPAPAPAPAAGKTPKPGKAK